MPAPSEQRFQSDLAVPLREPIKLSLPLSNQIWQVFARADPAAGSTINVYKTSLQLPGSHLGIHLAATHLLVIKHCLMYRESMKLAGVPVPVWPQGFVMHVLLYKAKVTTFEQKRMIGMPSFLAQPGCHLSCRYTLRRLSRLTLQLAPLQECTKTSSKLSHDRSAEVLHCCKSPVSSW